MNPLTSSDTLSHLNFLQQTTAYQELLAELKKEKPLKEFSYFHSSLFNTLIALFVFDDSVALEHLLAEGLPMDIDLPRSGHAHWEKPSNLGSLAVEHDAVKCLTVLVGHGLDLIDSQLNKDLGSNLSLAVKKKSPACFDYILTQKSNTITNTDVGNYGQFLLTAVLTQAKDEPKNKTLPILERLLSIGLPWSMFKIQEYDFENSCLDDSHNALDYMLAQDIISYKAQEGQPEENLLLLQKLIDSAKDTPLRLKKIQEFLVKYQNEISDLPPIVGQYIDKVSVMIDKNKLTKIIKPLRASPIANSQNTQTNIAKKTKLKI